MGFNKKMVPPLAELQKQLETSPNVINNYLRADALIGPSNSINYIETLCKSKDEKISPREGDSVKTE